MVKDYEPMVCCDVNVSHAFHVSPTARSLVGFDVSKGEQRVVVSWGENPQR